jgi:hypothetical protein
VHAQRARALLLANHIRSARSKLKAQIAEGALSAAEVVVACPPDIASMPIVDLLTSQRGWGEFRSCAFLDQVAVRAEHPIGALTVRQRQAIAALLTQTAR